SPSINPNPVLSVSKTGTVLYSNEAGEPLLREWGVEGRGKLPAYIEEIVKKVISRNNPEKMEIKVGKRVYLVAFHPSPEGEYVNIYRFDISDRTELKEKVQESESPERANVELAEIIDIQTVQSLMDDFYKLVHIPIGLRDLKDNVLAGVGFQDICSKFHRVHPETCKYCIESRTEQSRGILPGEYKLYKCRNNMWDILTPITANNQHLGNIIAGQFIFEDEPLDYELFRSQAREYGFNEEEYITALEKVPRLSRETVDTTLSFFMKFANILSQLSYSNNKLAQSLAEREALLEALSESEEKYRNIVETANEGIALINSGGIITYTNKKMADMLGYAVEELVDRAILELAAEEEKSAVTTSFEKGRLGNSDSVELKLIRKDGSPLWVFVNSKPLFDKDGKFIGVLNLHTDITERKNAEETLKSFEIARQKEIHHRIKNNLQVISSLLDLQAEKFRERDKIRDSEVLEAFKESQSRVISMALIHEELYKGEMFGKLNFSSYIKELADNLLLTYRLGNFNINLNMDLCQNVFFDIDTAVPLGIIINELVSNSLKHAFPDRNGGEIRIKLSRDDDYNTSFTLIISDNGIGIPENLNLEDIDSLGLQLVTSLVDQLEGKFKLKRGNGTEFTIRFTVTDESNQASAAMP
ncbi:MAG TPA: PocR ligand-binding domain-containing protein, partial [Methanosarcina sp.]|nr:PocR ligand-binding domain-containing protein [Methanosarcina sp.]